MVDLGKNENGVTLFNMEDSVKIDILGLGGAECLVNYDTRNYDEYRGPHARWFLYGFGMVRNENQKLCEPFDEFFKNAFEMLINNRSKYENHRSFGTNKSILNIHGGDNYQINYSSDDNSYEDATMLGITKYKEEGYSLDFDKNSKDLAKLSWVVKQDGGHYPDLARLFVKLFLELNSLAIRSYENCQEEFNQTFAKKLVKKQQQSH